MTNITKIKDEIKDLLIFLNSNNENIISKIEKDILLQKLRDLYLIAYDLETNKIENNVSTQTLNNKLTKNLQELDDVITFFDEDINNKNLEQDSTNSLNTHIDDNIINKNTSVETILPTNSTTLINSSQKTEQPNLIIINPILPKSEETVSEPKKEEIKTEEKVIDTAKKSEINQNLETDKKLKTEKPSNINQPNNILSLFSNPNQKTLGEQLGENKTSINDTIAPKQQTSLNDITSMRSIKDIKSSISIGDRYLFVKELFKGNLKEYGTAIDKLDSFSDIQTADNYLFNELNFDNTNPTFITFYNIVKRKYI